MKFPPRFQDFIPPDAVKQLVDMVAQPGLINGIKDAASKLGWKESWNPTQLQDAMQQAKRWVESVTDRFHSESPELRNCINATGEIFSSRFLATPLSSESIRAQVLIQEGFIQGEVQHDHEAILKELTGCEDVVMVGSLPQAIRLLAQLPQSKQGWLIPKSDCIRLPRSSSQSNPVDLRDLLGTFGCPIREVGASNECGLSDIEEPMQEGLKAILSVERPDRSGANRVHREMILEVAKKRHAITCELLLAGSLHRMESLSPIPTTIRERIEAGVDLVAIAGNGLIGGPSSGILLGKSSMLGPIRSWIARTGLEIDAPTLAAWNATLTHSKSLDLWKQVSIGQLLSTSIENLSNRASRIATQLNGADPIQSVSVESRPMPIGSGIWQGLELTSSVVVVQLKSDHASAFSNALANRNRPILPLSKGDRIEFVLRTIDPSEDHAIVEAFWPAS